MPRQTPLEELQNTEATQNSPLRRSTRITAAVTSTPSKMTTRRSSVESNSSTVSNVSTTSTRGRVRPPSVIQDGDEEKTKKPTTATRGRRGSISKAASEEPEVSTPTKPRGRRGSTSKTQSEPPQDTPKPRGRRGSTSQEPPPEPNIEKAASKTRTRRNSASQEPPEPRKGPLTRRRSASVDEYDLQPNTPAKVKTLNPTLTKSITDSPTVSATKVSPISSIPLETVEVLSPIKETDNEKTENVKTDFDLSIIAESSEEPETELENGTSRIKEEVGIGSDKENQSPGGSTGNRDGRTTTPPPTVVTSTGVFGAKLGSEVDLEVELMEVDEIEEEVAPVNDEKKPVDVTEMVDAEFNQNFDKALSTKPEVMISPIKDRLTPETPPSPRRSPRIEAKRSLNSSPRQLEKEFGNVSDNGKKTIIIQNVVIKSADTSLEMVGSSKETSEKNSKKRNFSDVYSDSDEDLELAVSQRSDESKSPPKKAKSDESETENQSPEKSVTDVTSIAETEISTTDLIHLEHEMIDELEFKKIELQPELTEANQSEPETQTKTSEPKRELNKSKDEEPVAAQPEIEKSPRQSVTKPTGDVSEESATEIVTKQTPSKTTVEKSPRQNHLKSAEKSKVEDSSGESETEVFEPVIKTSPVKITAEINPLPNILMSVETEKSQVEENETEVLDPNSEGAQPKVKVEKIGRYSFTNSTNQSETEDSSEESDIEVSEAVTKPTPSKIKTGKSPRQSLLKSTNKSKKSEEFETKVSEQLTPPSEISYKSGSNSEDENLKSDSDRKKSELIPQKSRTPRRSLTKSKKDSTDESKEIPETKLASGEKRRTSKGAHQNFTENEVGTTDTSINLSAKVKSPHKNVIKCIWNGNENDVGTVETKLSAKKSKSQQASGKSPKERRNSDGIAKKILDLIATSMDSDSEEDDDNDDEDDDDDEKEPNEYISTMAEEGEEDTPSEGSNDIIDLGEEINTTESEFSTDTEYQDDSFIDDEGGVSDLLSGNEEFDLSLDSSPKKKKKSRIIPVNTDNEDETEIIRVKTKKKAPVEKKKKHKSRIIQQPDSSDAETELVNVDEGVSPHLELSRISVTNQSLNKSSPSILVHESIKVDEDPKKAWSERLHKVVDEFCSTVNTSGEVSINVSFEMKPNETDGEKNQDLNVDSQMINIDNLSSTNASKASSSVDSFRTEVNKTMLEVVEKKISPESKEEDVDVEKVDDEEAESEEAEAEKAEVEQMDEAEQIEEETSESDMELEEEQDLEDTSKVESDSGEEESGNVLETTKDSESSSAEDVEEEQDEGECEEEEDLDDEEEEDEYDEEEEDEEDEDEPMLMTRSKAQQLLGINGNFTLEALDSSMEESLDELEDFSLVSRYLNSLEPAQGDLRNKLKKKSKNKKRRPSLQDQALSILDKVVLDNQTKMNVQKAENLQPSSPQLPDDWKVTQDAVKPSKSNDFKATSSSYLQFKEDKCKDLWPSGSFKFHAKDFKNQTLYDRSRVNRVETNKHLQRRGLK